MHPDKPRRRRLAAWLVLGFGLLLLVVYGRARIDSPAQAPRAQAPQVTREYRNAPFITSPQVVVDKMVELADPDIDEMIYDLGCGDGRIVIAAALRSGCRGIGFDIDPQRVNEARRNVTRNGLDDLVQIREQDIFTADLSPADVAMMYLLPWMMNSLLPQFERMQPGSRIVAHDFWIEGIEPDQVVPVQAEDGEMHTIYLYRTPLRPDPSMPTGAPPRRQVAP